jgi:uncharacterized protein YaaW (UPF0174 family)
MNGVSQTGSASLIQAIRGPVLMIVVGALFAIDHQGMAPFSRTWPALLIVIGLLKLLERAEPRGV